jgi:hypothetical protein
VVRSLEEIDSLLGQATPIDESTSTSTLRQWRTDLVRASVLVSYAIGVLSLDVEILTRGETVLSGDVVAASVEDLPDILANGWVGGGWSLSPDAAASVGAAAEIAMDESNGLLALHAEVVMSDLADPEVVGALLTSVEEFRAQLVERREQLESRIRRIQEVVLAQYGTGAASVDDWLT